MRAKTNWHKVRIGVRKILQQTRDREQRKQFDICEECETPTYTRGSKRLSDEVKIHTTKSPGATRQKSKNKREN